MLLVGAGVVATDRTAFYDVVAQGRDIVPHQPRGGKVYKIRVLGTFTMYADDESKPSPDKIDGAGLTALATASLITFLLLRAAAVDRRLRRFYLLLTLGLAFLAVDELFAIHETVGENLNFLAELPGIVRADDFVKLLYLIPTAIFVVYFRDQLLSSRRTAMLFAAAVGFFAVHAASDILNLPTEAPAKLAGTLCIGAGLVLLMAQDLNRRILLPRRAEPVGARPRLSRSGAAPTT